MDRDTLQKCGKVGYLGSEIDMFQIISSRLVGWLTTDITTTVPNPLTGANAQCTFTYLRGKGICMRNDGRSEQARKEGERGWNEMICTDANPNPLNCTPGENSVGVPFVCMCEV